MAQFTLRLFTDRLAAGAALALGPPRARRILYVAAGDLLVAAGDSGASLAPNSAWQGAEATLRAGAAGAQMLRFELAAGDGAEPAAASGTGIESRLTLGAAIELDVHASHLIRCDRVAFPPGGVAYTHTHQGPGIRCVAAGRIRVETAGTLRHHGPGEAWFEAGPDPVFAAGSETEATSFIRVMVLPSAYLGRSSIRYVRAEDQDKPKRQSYQIYIDAPLALPGGSA